MDSDIFFFDGRLAIGKGAYDKVQSLPFSSRGNLYVFDNLGRASVRVQHVRAGLRVKT